MRIKKIAFLIIFFMTLTGIVTSSSFYKPGTLKDEKRLRSPLEPPSQQDVKPHFWRVTNDILLYNFQSGEGQPVLVIHGGPGFPPSNVWEGLERLKHKFRFIYYHQRGCGKSTRPVDTFDSNNFLQNMVDLNKILGAVPQIADIERIRRILNQEKIILIGHSYGGFSATLYAVEFPEHVEKMVLIAPAGVLKMPIDKGGGLDALKDYLSEEMKNKFDAFIARYFNYGQIFSKSEKDLIALNNELIQFYEAAYETRGLSIPDQAGQDPSDTGGWMVHALYLSLGLEYDFRNELRKVQAPVLVIHGEKDVMPSEASREYSDLFSEGRLAIIPEATHFPFLETPASFAKLVSEFL